jgi:hypothetical protein
MTPRFAQTSQLDGTVARSVDPVKSRSDPDPHILLCSRSGRSGCCVATHHVWTGLPLALGIYGPLDGYVKTKFRYVSVPDSGRWYSAGKNISFQARTFCSVPEHFVPSVHFLPKSNLILINLPLNTVF